VSRPNVELIEFTQWLRADVRGLPTDLSKVVGMHVRRGDATGLMGRPRWDVSDYTAVFRAMLANQGGFTTVFFSSDEPAVYKEMAAALEHPEVRGIYLVALSAQPALTLSSCSRVRDAATLH
jgi:hypothetical protein